jgi:diphthine-ammonia ligase
VSAFISWSGGKDSFLAFWRARLAGIEVAVLLNLIDEDGVRSRTHGLRADFLRAQARALGLDIIQPRASWDSYESVFKESLREFARRDIRAGVFGDIDFEPHREWVARICAECGIEPWLPLWGTPRDRLLHEQIDGGFKAVVCAVDTRKLDASWLGRTVDRKFVSDIQTLPGVDPSGEAGEYHTVVLDGPVFRERLTVVRSARLAKEHYALLDILDYRLDGAGRANRERR